MLQAFGLTQNFITVLVPSFFGSRAIDETNQKSPCLEKKMAPRKAAWHFPTWQKLLSKPTMSCSSNKALNVFVLWLKLQFKNFVWEHSGGTCNWSEANENLDTPKSFFLIFIFFIVACCALNWIMEGSPCHSAGQEAVFRPLTITIIRELQQPRANQEQQRAKWHWPRWCRN